MASAQTGNCEPALGEAILDAGNVRAKIINNGGLFWRGGAPVYEVPKESGVDAIFVSSIWIVGMIDSELKGSATRYGPWEFWAGPLDAAGNPPADCTPFDKIWEIRREDIVAFLNDGRLSKNLRDWPWQLGAPVIDGDGNPDNYNLVNGDLPQLFGDQRLWWIMNDRGNEHLVTRGEPIGLEIRASAHAFNRPGFAGNITFYDYVIINKNTSDLTDAYFSLYNDAELGDFSDNYVGSDSLLHMSYAYNADNNDEGAYGLAPPAIGFTFLKTAFSDADDLDNDRDGIIDEAGEMIGASSFIIFDGGARTTGTPSNLSEYYNYMQSRWKDGEHLTFGGSGYGFSSEEVNFLFPGNPALLTEWSDLYRVPNNSALIGDPGNRHGPLTSGPFTITSGDTLNIRFAVVWSRGDDHLDSVAALKQDVRTLQVAPATYYSGYTQILTEVPLIKPTYVLGFDQNFPNPFDRSTVLRYSLPQTMHARLTVYDILGREIEVLVDQQQEAGIYTINFEAGALPSGIYMARIELDHLRFTKRMVLAR
ncbi:MAG: T9SS type A sorting domain-containing protein [Rhodothermales bacterium]